MLGDWLDRPMNWCWMTRDGWLVGWMDRNIDRCLDRQ